MIILRGIKLTNFLSHSSTELEFKPDQQILLDGLSGSGKSSIIDAITWVFYGQGRSDNRSLIKRGKKKAIATVTLDNKIEEEITKIKIERKIDDKGKHELDIYEAKEGENFKPIKTTGIKDTQEYLEKKILKSSYILFVNSIIYPQDNVDNFVKQTAVKRKEILLEIIHASDYDEYNKKAKKELQDAKKDKEVNEALVIEKDNSITADRSAAEKLAEREEKEKTILKEKNEIEKKLAKNGEDDNLLTQAESIIRSKEDKVEELDEEIKKNNTKIFNNQKRIDELDVLDVKGINENIEKLNISRKLLAGYKKEKEIYNEWNIKLVSLLSQKPVDIGYERQINELNRQIISIIGEPALVCPKCGSKYPQFEENKQKRIKVLEEQLNTAKSDLDAFKIALAEHDKKVMALGEQPKFNDQKIKELTAEVESLEPFEKKATELNGKDLLIQELKKSNTEIEKENQEKKISKKNLQAEVGISASNVRKQKADLGYERQQLEMKKNDLSIRYNSNLEELAISREAVKRIKTNSEDLSKLKKQLELIAERNESLELVKDAFGPNGIKAIVIDYLLPELEDRINNILSQLSDFRVRLETQKGGITKDTTIEGLFITIINDQGEQLDFSLFSGGEKIKISTAISEGLASIQNYNFRVFDESIIGLDDNTIDSFSGVMLKLKENIGQIICISHIQTVQDLFDERISVTKVNGDSKIEKI